MMKLINTNKCDACSGIVNYFDQDGLDPFEVRIDVTTKAKARLRRVLLFNGSKRSQTAQRSSS